MEDLSQGRLSARAGFGTRDVHRWFQALVSVSPLPDLSAKNVMGQKIPNAYITWRNARFPFGGVISDVG